MRGRGGGIRLMRKPSDINIGQVVRQTEDRLDVIGCLDQTGYCRIERACVLRSVLCDATDTFLAIFGRPHPCGFDQAAEGVVGIAFRPARFRASRLEQYDFSSNWHHVSKFLLIACSGRKTGIHFRSAHSSL